MFVSANVLAQGSETFTNISGSSGTYAGINWTGDNNLPWTASDSRTDQVMNGKCITVRNGSVACAGIPGGAGTLSFNYKQFFSTAGSLEVRINNNVVGTVTPTTSQQAASIPVNVTGTFDLEIRQTVSGGRIGIDDISWTGNSVPCVAPGAQPTGLSFASVGYNDVSASFTATTASGYLAIISPSATLSQQPVNGTLYNTDDALGNGVIAYNGGNTAFTYVGLTRGTVYNVFVYAYNNSLCSGGPVYNLVTPLQGSFTTPTPPVCTAPVAAATALSLTPASTTVTGSFTTATSADGYLVIRSNVATPGFTPVNGTVYSTGQVSGNVTIVKFGTGGNFTATGLTAQTRYYFFVYSMNQYNCTGGPLYYTTALSGNALTTNTPATDWPTGYYDFATGKSCATLKTALKQIVDVTANSFSGDVYQLNPQTYDALWQQYRLTDIKPREIGSGSANVIWDVYSDIPGASNDPYNYTPGSNECGNYSGEGNCYNREHSFPKSWFNDASPMVSDYLHIYPTDGFVNGKRSNYRYGEVATATYSSQNGSKLGQSATAGVTGVVFEPISEYKGDLARTYLYMVTCYENLLPTWKSYTTDGAFTLDGTTFPGVNINYLRLMLKWHTQDPVSQKEKDRNNGAFSFQGNRNPFIDHPEYVDMIWNASCPGLSALPVDLVSFSGRLDGNTARLEWEAANELNFAAYEIERSTDGAGFVVVGKVAAANAGRYAYNDPVQDQQGSTVYYRLRLVDKDGSYKYSAVLRLGIPARYSLRIFPNPVVSNTFTIRLQQQPAVALQGGLLDITGRTVQRFQVNALSTQVPVHQVTNGTYFIQVTGPGGERYMQKIVIAK